MTMISVNSLENFEKTVARLNKKSVKLTGREAISFTVSESRTHTVTVKTSEVWDDVHSESFESLSLDVVDVQVTIDDSCLVVSGDWTLQTTIAIKDGVKTVFGQMVEDQTMTCQHCGSKRTRSLCFDVRAADGRQLRVGSTCVKDFLGNDTAQKWLLNHEIYDVMQKYISMNESEIDDECRRCGVRSISAERALAAAFDIISTNGYNEETKIGILNTAFSYADVSEVAKNHARAFVAKTLAGSPQSSFEATVKNIVQSGYCTMKLINWLSGAMASYIRTVKQQATANASNHVGNVGDKITTTVTVINQKKFESRYGDRYLNSFADENGNVLVTWTNKFIGQVGEKIAIRGTIKEHSEYNNVKQTVLLRVA